MIYTVAEGRPEAMRWIRDHATIEDVMNILMFRTFDAAAQREAMKRG